MLLILPNLSCYSSYPTYHATHLSLFIMLLILPNLSCYSSFPTYHATGPYLFIMLHILPSLPCYSSLPPYHVTHTSQLIMLLIFPNLSCYLPFPIYHATRISPFIMLLILPTYHTARPSLFINPLNLPLNVIYKWCRAENAPKVIKKRFSKPTNQPSNTLAPTCFGSDQATNSTKPTINTKSQGTE